MISDWYHGDPNEPKVKIAEYDEPKRREPMKISINTKFAVALGVFLAGNLAFAIAWHKFSRTPEPPVVAAPVAEPAPKPTKPSEVIDWSHFETEALGMKNPEIDKRWTCPCTNLGADGTAYYVHRTGPNTYDRYTVEWRGAKQDGMNDKGTTNLIDLKEAVAANIIKESLAGKPE